MGIKWTTNMSFIIKISVILGSVYGTSSHRRTFEDSHGHTFQGQAGNLFKKGESGVIQEAAYRDFHWGYPGSHNDITKYSDAHRGCTSLDKARHRYRFEDSLSNLYVGYTLTSTRQQRQNRDRRHINDTPHQEKALHFSGSKETLVLTDSSDDVYRALTGNFTLELWVRPEGGQHSPVSIVGLYDTCVMTTSNLRGWTLGIKNALQSEHSDSRFFFHLHGDRSRERTVVMAPNAYQPEKWRHLAVTYNGEVVQLYVDGTRVSTGHGQKGLLFSHPSAQCKKILLGAEVKKDSFYRGAIDQLRLWSVARTHVQIVEDMRWSITDDLPTGVILQDDFNSLQQWDTTLEKNPKLFISRVPDTPSGLHLKPSPCGVTICDNPQISLSYATNQALRNEKFVRYNVVNVAEDDGSNPTVTQQQIELQDRALRDVFRPYNITWKLDEVKVLNSSLRRKTILIACKPENVGDEYCHRECQHESTGNDGGDCDTEYLSCQENQKGNGICDDNCNRAYHNWDDGDCCTSEAVSVERNRCFNPRSPQRAFLSIEEYKSHINNPSDRQLNIYFAYWTLKDLVGLATFPWEKEVFSILGGTVVRPDTFGRPDKSDSLVHELGHNLGLWHVHHGVSEITDCGDPCRETQASMTHGDLCEDTNPTTENWQCRDPLLDRASQMCGFREFQNTPFTNYMSYAGDQCTDHFTPQQIGRMHCYLDLTYQPWQLNVLPSPVALAPRVVKSTADSLTLVWIPPMGSGATAYDLVCKDCQGGHPLVQYAHTASSNTSTSKYDGAPSQASGGPDVDRRCAESPQAWMPDHMTDCSVNNCVLELAFKYPAVAQSLWIWVTWNSQPGLKDVELVFKDETSHSLGFMPTVCDMPLTIPLNMNKLLRKVRIHVDTPYVAIDAVKMTSEGDHPKCRHCPRMKYRLTREPAFGDRTNPQNSVIVNAEEYMDEEVERGQTYKYYVQALLGNKDSAASPQLVHEHGTSFCGDGHIDDNEECDDRNTINNDGCNDDCKTEKDFNCQGTPSLCYVPQGDGICEEGEEETSPEDCGWLTPEGFVDQWAHSVKIAPEQVSSDCPSDVILGPPEPAKIKKCNVDSMNPSVTWYPCNFSYGRDIIWIEVYIHRPVVATNVILYITTDDLFGYTTYRHYETMTVELLDEAGIPHSAGAHDVIINCAQHPYVIDIEQKLSDPFRLTTGLKLTWSSTHVGISGVAVRSRPDLDPVTLDSCQDHELYSPVTGSCVPYSCQRTQCAPHVIKYGDISCSGSAEGDTCTVTCDPGYKLASHKRQLTCIGGEWVSPGYDVRCVPRDCGPPLVAQATTDCPDGTTFGKRCKFECVTPAKKQGSDTTLICETDGMWSIPHAFCLATCIGPPVVKDAVVVTQSCDSSDVAVGTKCKLRCKHGYHVSTRSMKRRQMYHTCSPEGSWEGPICARIQCEAPSPIYNGLYSCTDDFYYGSQCTLKCPGPTRLTSSIQCTDYGKWDSEYIPCKFEPGQCPALSQATDMNFSCNGRSSGNECDVSCLSPEEIPILRTSAMIAQTSRSRALYVGSYNTQEEGATESHPDLVRKVTCTGRLVWYPDTSSIVCWKKCIQDFIGDGSCDAVNNRIDCQWDGGDCCTTTVPGGHVRPFPATCTTACECKDPTTVERTHQATAARTTQLENRRRFRLMSDRRRRILAKSGISPSRSVTSD